MRDSVPKRQRNLQCCRNDGLRSLPLAKKFTSCCNDGLRKKFKKCSGLFRPLHFYTVFLFRYITYSADMKTLLRKHDISMFIRPSSKFRSWDLTQINTTAFPPAIIAPTVHSALSALLYSINQYQAPYHPY